MKNDKNTDKNRIIQVAVKTPLSSVGVTWKPLSSCLRCGKKSINAVCTKTNPVKGQERAGKETLSPQKNDKNTEKNRIILVATKTPRSSVGVACRHRSSFFRGQEKSINAAAPNITLYKARKGPERKHPVHTKWQKRFEKLHNSSRNQNTSIKRRGHLKASVVLSQGPKEEYQRCLHRNQSCLRLSRWPERKQWVHKKWQKYFGKSHNSSRNQNTPIKCWHGV